MLKLLFGGAYYLIWRLIIRVKKQHTSGYIKSCNAEIYYEIYDCQATVDTHSKDTPPILLIHGGLVAMNAWFCQLPSFAKHHRLISIDLRGHGRSSLETDNLSYRLMAEDVVCLLEKLSISKVCVVGWSDGGNVGLMLSLKHPKIISKLVAISANFHPSGVRQERRKDLELLTPETYNPFTRLLYTLQSPRPNNWNTLWFQVTNMWKTRPQITLKELSTIQTPTLLIVGEFDDISPDHSNTMEYTIPNATLHIIKGAGHGVIHDSYGEVNEIILKFLYQ